MNPIKLVCPSCGGKLELPNNLPVAHCIYCGTKILLDQDSVVREGRDIQRYIELCRVAVEAQNHKEAIEYCNKILEIDPKNVEAWINKAISTFWLTTGANNRYDEAMEYLAKASQIAPDDDRIETTRRDLTKRQALWHKHLGNQEWETSQKMYKIEYDYYQRLDYVSPDHNAKVATAEYAIKVMDYYLIASEYDPDNITILENIAVCARFYHVVTWNERVSAKLKKLEQIKARKVAEQRLQGLKSELQKAQTDYAVLRSKGGFLAGIRLKDLEDRIANLQAQIAKLEKDFS